MRGNKRNSVQVACLDDGSCWLLESKDEFVRGPAVEGKEKNRVG